MPTHNGHTGISWLLYYGMVVNTCDITLVVCMRHRHTNTLV